jgi:hypothetical protein
LGAAVSPLLSTMIVAAEAASGASRARPSNGAPVRAHREELLRTRDAVGLRGCMIFILTMRMIRFPD